MRGANEDNIMERRGSSTVIRSILFIALLILPIAPKGIDAQASDADKLISIGSITANPQANNRRVVLFKGKAIDIRMITGGALGIPTCGQAFTLEDETGSIDVWYMIKCHHEDHANVVIVGEKDQLLVSATIDASPATDLQTSIKPDTGFRAMVMKLVRLKP
jgi:hypothetical protein